MNGILWKLIRLNGCTSGTKKWYKRGLTIIEGLTFAVLFGRIVTSINATNPIAYTLILISLVFNFITFTWMYQDAANGQFYRESHSIE